MEFCDLCDRFFNDRQALHQHMQNSSAHCKSSRCKPCNRSFVSQSALNQHVRDSPAHTARAFCEDCNKSFGSQAALDQHIQYSSAHDIPPATPLDQFFRSFQSFEYDPKLTPSKSFFHLQSFYGWRKQDANDKSAWKRYQSALEEEVRLWFGEEDDLSSWHSLCRAIGIEPLPTTCAQGVRVSTCLFHMPFEYSQFEIDLQSFCHIITNEVSRSSGVYSLTSLI